MRFAAVFAVLSLAACATPCPSPDTAPTVSNFTCEDGSTMRVTFTHHPDRALIEQEGYTSLNLPARIIGSGFRFSDGGAEFRGRGSQAEWMRPGAAETTCHETSTAPAGS
jgi:hypothetical protein